jgi:hypothetical protein
MRCPDLRLLLLLLSSLLHLSAANSPESAYLCSACIAAGGIWYTGENAALSSKYPYDYYHDAQVHPQPLITQHALKRSPLFDHVPVFVMHGNT